MASVLDAFPGYTNKDFVFMSAVPDECYANWVAKIESLKPKDRKQWKCSVERSDGSTQTVRFEKDGFYSHYLNQRIRVISVSGSNRLREEKPTTTHLQFEETFQMDRESFFHFHDEQMAAAHTGNHRPRNHRIGVPTRAGEPVRG